MSHQPDISFYDPTWQKVCQWLEEEWVDSLRELSNLSITEKRADQIRGKAAFIRMLLDFENAATPAA